MDFQAFFQITGIDSGLATYHSWHIALLRVHNDATADLREIAKTDLEGFYRLVALVEQLKQDPRIATKLLDHNFGKNGSEEVSVMKWLSVQKTEHLPLWRLKAWDLENNGLKYRLIYCYHWPDRSFNIMAIVPRAQLDYDDAKNPIRIRVTKRVREEFPGA